METLEKAKLALRKYISENKEDVLIALDEMRKMSDAENFVENICKNCKFQDEYSFCEKLVIDTKRCHIDDKYIMSNYISVIEDDDDRSSFIVPDDFGCVYFEKKNR